MLLQFGTKTALMLAKPVILAVIEDIIKSGTIPEHLQKLKGEMINGLLALTGKTSFSWDDRLAEAIIKHMLEGGVIDALTEMILSKSEIWVMATETKWDDQIVLPVIQQFRKIIVVEGK
jgi:hypothetical protein